MPMFPLGSVLLPGAILPLHVFEPRYRQMISDCLASDGSAEFGQTLITHGQETGGGDTRAMIGTIARIAQVDALDASRYALVVVGDRRIKVTEWLADDPYPMAHVADWPDVVSSKSDIAERIIGLHHRVQTTRELAIQLADATVGAAPFEIADEPILATYNLAALAPIGPADRLRILASAGPHERLVLLDEILDDVEAMLKFRLS
jgi:Lon protease-like protein